MTAGPQSDQSISSLLGGIVQDGQDLLRQQLQMFRSEVKQELRQLRSGVAFMGVGAVILGLGAIFLLGMLVHLLDAYSDIPLWGCYGIVGGALALVGAFLLVGGRKSVADVHLAPPPMTAETLKENVRWVAHPKSHAAAETA